LHPRGIFGEPCDLSMLWTPGHRRRNPQA
jgi:hypothetical protein